MLAEIAERAELAKQRRLKREAEEQERRAGPHRASIVPGHATSQSTWPPHLQLAGLILDSSTTAVDCDGIGLVHQLSKEPRYYYDAEAVREPAVSKPSSTPWPMPAIHGGKYQSLHDPLVRSATKYLRRDAPISSTRHKRSVWAIPTEPFRGSHTATFPSRLVEPCILAGSSAAGCCSRCGRPWERMLEITYRPLSNRREGRKDPRVFELEQRQMREARTTGWRPTCHCGAAATPAVVLDPFAGTGTTLKVAKQHGRTAIGIELNAQFVDMIRRRCADVTSSAARREAA